VLTRAVHQHTVYQRAVHRKVKMVQMAEVF